MTKPRVTTGLLLVLALLASADYALVERSARPAPAAQSTTTGQTSTSSESRVSAQVSSAPQPPATIAKPTGPDVPAVLASHAFALTDPSETSILDRVIPAENGEMIVVHVLLKNDDRAGLAAWVDSPQVKQYFLILKEALHASFSPQVSDLLDETQQRENKPIRNLLTFLDPGIAPERIVFVRVRQRLYEFHIAEGMDDAIFAAIEALTE